MMLGYSDADVSVAIAFAVAALLVIFFLWPGLAIVRAKDLAGHWVSRKTGNMYEMRATGSRKLAVMAGGKSTARVSLSWVKSISLKFSDGSKKRGSVEFGGRQISWDNGADTWVLQGVR